MNIPKGLISGSFLIAAVLSAKEIPLDSLLNRIEVRFETYVDYDTFSASVLSVTKQMDGKWSSKEETLIEKNLTVMGNESEEEIIRAVKKKKGKETDITEKLRKEQEKIRERQKKRRMEHAQEEHDDHGGAIRIELKDMLPFATERRDLYGFSLLPDSLIADRSVYAVQAVLKEKAENAYEGRYYCDKETYDLLFIDVRPSQNPRFVKNLNMKMWFDVLENRYIVLRQNWMRVYASILIKKIRMEITEYYSNHQIMKNGTVTETIKSD